MRHGLIIVSLVLAIGSIEGCSCNSNNGAFMGDVDAYIFDHDGMLPPGVDLAPGPEDMAGFVPFPDPDGGIVITLDGGGTFTCFIAPCQGKVYQCGNCLDDDKDGLIDSMDPNCLGPCQNNEAGFYGNIPGQNNAPCKSDCYWDQDTGSGNDECNWSHDCDPFEAQAPAMTMPEIGCKYDPNAKVPGATVPNGQKDCAYLLNTQTTTCGTVCKPLTPNGCDCFGCCENPKAPGTYIFAGSANASGVGTCDVASLSDPAKCKSCTPVVGCGKACGRCQLCFGKTAADLPPDCFTATPDGGTPADPDAGTVPPPNVQCPGGEVPCGLPGQAACQPGYFCVTGCCQSIIF